jgi:hypothetical protein
MEEIEKKRQKKGKGTTRERGEKQGDIGSAKGI